MTDESTNWPGRQTTPPSNPGLGDPARHDFGDRTDETEDRAADDAGEGHKGPLVDATKPGAKRKSSYTGTSSEGESARPEDDKFGR
jgi:hypothetical protein